ncbi:MAG TPA: SMI1/KNR4 family protein [Pyrinomonadaceae bacterium]
MKANEIDYLAGIKAFHRAHVEPYKGKPKGCWDFEIRRLEKSFGCELPLAYKQYLKWMGKDYRGIFVGCDWFITDVENNTELVPELLAENNVSFQLPAHYLCFFSHQGYMAAWFELPKVDDDPPSWFYNEAANMDQPLIEGRFTEILLKDMSGFVATLPFTYKRAT